MISTILFALSALCVAAMFSRGQPPKKSRSSTSAPTYHVGDNTPLPNRQRRDRGVRRAFPRVARYDSRSGNSDWTGIAR